MKVANFGGGSSAEIDYQTSTPPQTVLDVDITWSVAIEYHDHPWFGNAQGIFRARISRFTLQGQWEVLDTADRRLGTGNQDGDWWDFLFLHTRMVDSSEIYRIDLHCEPDVFLGPSEDKSIFLVAVQGSVAVGSFILDYQPVSIVYCPPNQDMSAALTQSSDYGTRVTIGESNEFQSSISVGADVDALGVKLGGVSITNSQSMSNRSEVGIEVSYFRNSVLTADNQRAIGRAYWGPLSDLFVIGVNSKYNVTKRADGTVFYSPSTVQDLIVLPAYKLLRPDGDPVASTIPEDVRRRLLELDPFITNLGEFFPDQGQPLERAANPYADPAVGNRAERLGRWWLNAGTELNYSIGERRSLRTGETNEARFETNVTAELTAGFSLADLIGVSVQTQQSFTTILGLQSSRETAAQQSSTGSCFLIRNQNTADFSGIEIYYDKIFSTLMFRKVSEFRHCIGGVVTDTKGRYLRALDVSAVAADGQIHRTLTDRFGAFCFYGLDPGRYEIKAGDRRTTVRVPVARARTAPSPVSISGVRREIDLEFSPRWLVADALGVSSDVVRRLAANSHRLFDDADLKAVTGLPTAEFNSMRRSISLIWPRTPLPHIATRHAERLQAAGIESVQELWRRGRRPADVAALADETEIPADQLQGWIASAEKRRASHLSSEELD